MDVEVNFPTDWDDQGVRKTAFAQVFRSLAAHEGYSVGPSLKVQGAYAFEMKKDGEVVRIGLKTSYDRWLNTAAEMVKKVDEVWIMTFRWSDPAEGEEEPTHLEVYHIPAEALRAKFDKVDAVRTAAGTPNAFAYIPLDKEGLLRDTAAYNKAAGHVLDTAKLLFAAPIVFTDDDPPGVVPSGAGAPSARSAASIFAKAKQLIVDELGYDPGPMTISFTV